MKSLAVFYKNLGAYSGLYKLGQTVSTWSILKEMDIFENGKSDF